MQQCNEKREFIQVAIYTDAVIGMMGAVAVISQNTFSFFRNG